MHVDPIGGRPRRAAKQNSAGPVSPMNQQFDLPGPAPLRKSYIIAATPRCGSTFLCTRLWATGLLGAPAEYFSYQKKRVGTKMMERLQASSPADYLGKLLSRRCSQNGVFGMSIEFNDFEEALRRFPGMLDALSPVTYIFVDRQDQLAQAAFMAKRVQADSGRVQQSRLAAAARYDRDLISKWLGRIERQRIGWMRWFAANAIEPFVLTYQQMTTRTDAAVLSIIELLDVENDEPQRLRIALAEKPSDRVSQQWAARFQREIRSGIVPDRAAAGPAVARTKTAPEARHIFDRYDAIKGKPARSNIAKRLRHRYRAIIAQNRDLFKNARVLDLHSGDGYWSVAALDAGAAHVVGVDDARRAVAAASRAFAKMGLNSASYRFVGEDMFTALNAFSPEAFDLILCREVSSDPHFFFHCLRRLKPKHVILDTRIADRKEPAVVFRLNQRETRRPGARQRSAAIIAVPNHELIKTLSDYFGFGWRAIDWHGLGIADWTGIHDYQSKRRRTYVLDPVRPAKAD
jgi:trehalose 2-sulfotransferase